MIVKVVNKHNHSERALVCLAFDACMRTQWAIDLPSGEVTFYAKSRWDLYKYTKEGFVNVEKTL